MAASEGAETGSIDAKPHYLDHRKRLRARFLDGDAETFPDYELLELLLCFAIDRVDVKPLAKALLAEFGSLAAVLAAEPSRLAAFERMGERPQALFRVIREAARRMLRQEPGGPAGDLVVAGVARLLPGEPGRGADRALPGAVPGPEEPADRR